MNNMKSFQPTKMKSLLITSLAFSLIACQGEPAAEVDTAKEVASEIANKAADTTAAVSETTSAVVNEATEKADAVKSASAKLKAQTSEAVNQSTTAPVATPTIVDPSTYTVLETPLTVSTGDNIEVTELFWYGCGHCYALETHVDNWKKSMPSGTTFVKVPAIFSERWAFHAKAFYTMETLGVLDQANEAFFSSIHKAKRGMNTIDALTRFLADYGKSEAEVTSAFNSFAVDSKFRNASLITRNSQANGVPAMLVDGKYLTSVTQTGSADKLFSTVNGLVEKAKSER